MKKNTTKTFLLIAICSILFLPTIADAATKNFNFNMTHTVGLGAYKATKNSATAKITMKSWGGDDYFTMRVYHMTTFSSKMVDKVGFSKSSAGSPYIRTTYKVKKGEKYSFELWKNLNGKRIKGEGTLSY